MPQTVTTVRGLVKSETATIVRVALGEAFGKILKNERKKLGLSQEELADLAGVSVRAISFYECNRRQPSLFMVFVLAKALKMKTSEFVGLVEAEATTTEN